MNQFNPQQFGGQAPQLPPAPMAMPPKVGPRPGPGPRPPAKQSAVDSFSWVTVVLLAFVAVVGFLWKYGYLIGGPK